jgi:hypothetical protein
MLEDVGGDQEVERAIGESERFKVLAADSVPHLAGSDLGPEVRHRVAGEISE